MIQRLLRDHFTVIAEQTLRSLNESLRAAQDAANLESVQRTERIAAVEEQLRVLTAVREATAGTEAGQ